MSHWRLLLSFVYPEEPARPPMVFERRLENTTEAECLRIGHEIAERLERDRQDRRIVVGCVKAGNRT